MLEQAIVYLEEVITLAQWSVASSCHPALSIGTTDSTFYAPPTHPLPFPSQKATRARVLAMLISNLTPNMNPVPILFPLICPLRSHGTVMYPPHQDTYVQGFAVTLFYHRRVICRD